MARRGWFWRVWALQMDASKQTPGAAFCAAPVQPPCARSGRAVPASRRPCTRRCCRRRSGRQDREERQPWFISTPFLICLRRTPPRRCREAEMVCPCCVPPVALTLLSTAFVVVATTRFAIGGASRFAKVLRGLSWVLGAVIAAVAALLVVLKSHEPTRMVFFARLYRGRAGVGSRRNRAWRLARPGSRRRAASRARPEVASTTSTRGRPVGSRRGCADV